MNLTEIFGSEIIVSPQPRIMQRQYAGIPGTEGLLSMTLGTRGRIITITGRLAATGASYAAARANLQTLIDAVEAYEHAEADDYTYGNETFYNVVFDSIQIIPDAQQKIYHFLSTGYVSCRFIAKGVILI